jgi:hypothetical protein
LESNESTEEDRFETEEAGEGGQAEERESASVDKEIFGCIFARNRLAF